MERTNNLLALMILVCTDFGLRISSDIFLELGQGLWELTLTPASKQYKCKTIKLNPCLQATFYGYNLFFGLDSQASGLPSIQPTQ